MTLVEKYKVVQEVEAKTTNAKTAKNKQGVFEVDPAKLDVNKDIPVSSVVSEVQISQ